MREYKYDVVLSFAGENRQPVETLAELLATNGYEVFYDRYEPAQLWGKDLYTHLSAIYKDKARYCVMFLSEHYARKLWTNHERRSAQARAFQENEEYILPVRLDDTEIPGILPTVGYLDLRLMSIEKIYQALVEKLSGSPSQQRTATSTSTVIEEDPSEFVLLTSEDEELYFIPHQSVRRDSSEMSLELLPESPEEVAFLRTLQDKLGNRFASSITLACAYREYASWVVLQDIVENSSHWEILLAPDTRGHNHDFFGGSTVNGIPPGEIAKMRARRILLDEMEDVDLMLEMHIRGMPSSSHEPGLQVTGSMIPQLYRQFGQTPERFKKFARLVSILHLKLSNTVENVLRLDLELIGPTQLQVRFKGIRPKFYSNEAPSTIEFEGICPLSE